jgi:hypothetical protein
MDYCKIIEICTFYNIRNYSINLDGSIDVDGNVNLFRRNLLELPIQFGTVTGSFNCVDNTLTSLNGSPKNVLGDFNCSHNLITSLEGGPVAVGGDYCIGANKLLDLTGCPNFIGRHLYIEGSMISTYSGEVDMEIEGIVYLNASNLYEEYMLGNSYVPKNLPLLLLENIKNITTIIKYQRYFEIWNEDLTLNEENFNDLVAEINEGLQ